MPPTVYSERNFLLIFMYTDIKVKPIASDYTHASMIITEFVCETD